MLPRERFVGFSSYIPSKDKTFADSQSHVTLSLDTEWELPGHAFQLMQHTFGKFSIDLLASSINHKC